MWSLQTRCSWTWKKWKPRGTARWKKLPTYVWNWMLPSGNAVLRSTPPLSRFIECSSTARRHSFLYNAIAPTRCCFVTFRAYAAELWGFQRQRLHFALQPLLMCLVFFPIFFLRSLLAQNAKMMKRKASLNVFTKIADGVVAQKQAKPVSRPNCVFPSQMSLRATSCTFLFPHPG